VDESISDYLFGMITKGDSFYYYENLSSKTKKLFKHTILQSFFENESKDRKFLNQIIPFFVKKEFKKDSYETMNKIISNFKKGSKNYQEFTIKMLEDLRFGFANEIFLNKLENLKEVYDLSISKDNSPEKNKTSLISFFNVLYLMSIDTFKNYYDLIDKILDVLTHYLKKSLKTESIELITEIIKSIDEKPLFFKSKKIIDYFLNLLAETEDILISEKCHEFFSHYYSYNKSEVADFFDTYFEISKKKLLNYKFNEQEWNKKMSVQIDLSKFDKEDIFDMTLFYLLNFVAQHWLNEKYNKIIKDFIDSDNIYEILLGINLNYSLFLKNMNNDLDKNEDFQYYIK
jgi:hypothetical protein